MESSEKVLTKEIIFTSEAPAPIGPYSQANRVGNMVLVSGQLGIAPGEKDLADSIEDQTRYALANLTSVLKAADMGLDSVVKTSCYLSDMTDFAAFNAIYGEYFTEKPPARSCIAVKQLPLGALVEIEAIAIA